MEQYFLEHQCFLWPFGWYDVTTTLQLWPIFCIASTGMHLMEINILHNRPAVHSAFYLSFFFFFLFFLSFSFSFLFFFFFSEGDFPSMNSAHTINICQISSLKSVWVYKTIKRQSWCASSPFPCNHTARGARSRLKSQ